MKTAVKLALAGVAALSTAAGAGIGISGGSAHAANPPDLRISQSTSDGSGSGHTTVTIKVTNVGATAAKNIILTNLIKTPGNAVGALFKSANIASACFLQQPPPGTQLQYSCSFGALNPGATYTLVEDYFGQDGKSFSAFATVGNSAGESTLSNNASTINSFYGLYSDLALSQASLVTLGSGARTMRDTVTNNGPATAHNLQMVLEIKAPGFTSQTPSSNLPTSCQFIPPASGFNVAVSCVTSVLNPGSQWIVTFNNKGTAGSSFSQTAKVTSFQTDPVPANNSATTTTTFTS